MRRRAFSRIAVVTIAALISIVCCVLPVVFLFALPMATGEFSASSLRLDGRQRALLWNSAVLGGGAAALATAIGAPLGFVLARMSLPRRAALRVILGIPVLLPPYILALAWTSLADGREWVYSLPMAIVVLALAYYPISMIATEVAMRRIDGRLEEAGLLVAPPRRVVSGITLPLAAPGILGAALLIFVLAVSEFGVPGLLRVRVYTTEVFTAFASLYDFHRALVLAFPLLLGCMVVSAVAGMIVADRWAPSARALGSRSSLLANHRRIATVAAVLVSAVSVGLPLVVLALEASGTRSLRTLLEGSVQAISNSLVGAAVGATATVMVGACLGYARARTGGGFGRATDVIFLVAFAVPSTILGVGLIAMWNRPGILGTLYGTNVMYLLVHLGRFLPIAALITAAAVRSVPVSHEEAAALSGAGWVRTMLRIVLPQARLGILAAWIVVFVMAFGELGASILIAPPGESTLPIRIYTLIANTPPSHVAGLALLQTLVILAPIAVVAAAVSLRATRITAANRRTTA